MSLKRVPTEIVTSFVEFFSDSIDRAEKLANLAERERIITTLSDVFFQSLIFRRSVKVYREDDVKIVIELETSSFNKSTEISFIFHQIWMYIYTVCNEKGEIEIS